MRPARARLQEERCQVRGEAWPSAVSSPATRNSARPCTARAQTPRCRAGLMGGTGDGAPAGSGSDTACPGRAGRGERCLPPGCHHADASSWIRGGGAQCCLHAPRWGKRDRERGRSGGVHSLTSSAPPSGAGVARYSGRGEQCWLRSQRIRFLQRNVEDGIRPVPRRGTDTTTDHFLAELPPIRRNVSAARLACLSDNVGGS